MTTVLIADDEPAIRDALAELIASEPSFELVGAAEDAPRAIELAGTMQPALAVIDVRMPGGGGARAARGIRECSPNTKILAYSAYDDRGTVLDMLRAGATSYVFKGTAADEVIRALLVAASGEASLSPEVTGGVVEALTERMETDARQHEEQRELQLRIHRTINDERFQLVFQPIVELHTGVVVGAEALTRFPDEPLQGPDRWFADAERAGLRTELELATAAIAIRQLANLALPRFLSINLSPDAVPDCQALVQTQERRVVIEITEHAVIDDYHGLLRDLNQLRRDGIRVAVDDAGAGFASLKHALELTPDFIKLDISLVRDIAHDRRRWALASGLIDFAAQVGAQLIAEGIETSQELDALRELGVPLGQGYHLAAPGPLDQISD